MLPEKVAGNMHESREENPTLVNPDQLQIIMLTPHPFRDWDNVLATIAAARIDGWQVA